MRMDGPIYQLLLAMLIVIVIGSCITDRSMHRSMSNVSTATESAVEYPGLHAVLHVIDGVFSGSQPEGNAGFDALRRMGVRTIISVDGAKPDVERAKLRGMRTIHLPIGYDGIDTDRQLLIAKAIRDLPGPVYIHCHHGKHRGPAAAAIAAVLLGKMDRAAARRFMEKAGTSHRYRGLYACVETASAVGSGALDTTPADFPERAYVSGIVQTMVEIDRVFDHLKAIRDAGWKTPADHPDLVPAAEAAQLAGLLRRLMADDEVGNRPADFTHRLDTISRSAADLEQRLTIEVGRPVVGLFDFLATSCKDCHRRYRD